MNSDVLDPLEAMDLIFYEAEAPQGFLASMMNLRVFDHNRWQRLWDAAANLYVATHGEFDIWVDYDLSRIITTVQAEGRQLIGRTYDDLTEFEIAIIDANVYLNDIISAG